MSAALLALGACGRAEAVPADPPLPAGWRALPELADAARRAGAAIERAAAWGDPARGCYAVAIGARGAGDPEQVARELVAGLALEPHLAGAIVEDVAASDRGVALAFEHAPYRGRLRAELGDHGEIAARACFWNEREPVACEAACAGMMK